MRINGKIYGIPSKKDNGYFISLIYNADMVEDLGIDLSDLDYSNFRDLEDLFYETKEARDEKYPEMAEYPIVWSVNLFYPYFFAFETFLNDSYMAVANIDGIMDIEGYESDTVFNFYDTGIWRKGQPLRRSFRAAPDALPRPFPGERTYLCKAA